MKSFSPIAKPLEFSHWNRTTQLYGPDFGGEKTHTTTMDNDDDDDDDDDKNELQVVKVHFNFNESS